MNHIETMKMALEWYDSGQENRDEFIGMIKSITAIAQGESEPVAECRGYALLGTGNYVINHSADFDEKLGAELIITLATDEDRAGNRQIGESRPTAEPGKPIEAYEMVIRIGFLNERGLFALEDQLSEIRKAHFGAVPQVADYVPMTQDRAEELAHRRCRRYIMIDDVPYQFDAHTLMDFVRDVERAVRGAK